VAVVQRRGRPLTLTWSAPGDDHQIGTAARYEVRMAGTPITAASFARGRLLGNAPRPAPAGTAQTLALPAPPPGVTYVALRAIDAAGNISALSNVVRIRR
jgi:hypothetical protein